MSVMMVAKPLVRPFLFTPQHEEILEVFSSYHLLTATQVTMLLRPTRKLGNLTTVKARLKALAANKYLQAFCVPTSVGPRPRVYCLGIRGRRLLLMRGRDVPVYFAPGQLFNFTHNWYTHPLELNNFLALAATLPAFDHRISFSDLRHDLTFVRQPVEWIDASGTLRTPRPDALFKLHVTRKDGTLRHHLLWIELDRGGCSPVRFRAKLSALWEFFCRSYHELYFSVKSMHVCFVTTAGERRLEAMRALARMEFGQNINPKRAHNQLFNVSSG